MSVLRAKIAELEAVAEKQSKQATKDGKGVSIRTNYDKLKIDVSYSVYLYVEEWNG